MKKLVTLRCNRYDLPDGDDVNPGILIFRYIFYKNNMRHV